MVDMSYNPRYKTYSRTIRNYRLPLQAAHTREHNTCPDKSPSLSRLNFRNTHYADGRVFINYGHPHIHTHTRLSMTRARRKGSDPVRTNLFHILITHIKVSFNFAVHA